jgi:hypothetical protein
MGRDGAKSRECPSSSGRSGDIGAALNETSRRVSRRLGCRARGKVRSFAGAEFGCEHPVIRILGVGGEQHAEEIAKSPQLLKHAGIEAGGDAERLTAYRSSASIDDSELLPASRKLVPAYSPSGS